jgi:hypothetical protein
MTLEKIEFYLRHRRQISEWAKLDKRTDDLMRDAVEEGAHDKATKLLKGASGDPEVDFYVRNRSLITEWDSLQTVAGEALHGTLVAAVRDAGFDAYEGKKGWTTVLFRSPEYDQIRADQKVRIELAWTRQDLLSTRRGYAFPRLALVGPDTWKGQSRDTLVKATWAVAQDLGMKKHDKWWVHWGMLDPISESQDLRSYADACVAKLQDASRLLYPVLVQPISATPVRP